MPELPHLTLSRDWWRERLYSDLPASFVVFLVALPLSMGIAIASGAPVTAGLVTGIVGGLVAGMLAGAPLQVSGPAAGLTVVVYQCIKQYGVEERVEAFPFGEAFILVIDHDLRYELDKGDVLAS